MIVTKLMGGLGNQMFQYAAARGIASQNENVFFDMSFLRTHATSSNTFTARKYELEIFKHLRAKIASAALLNICKGDRRIHRVLRKLFLKPVVTVTQTDNGFIPDLQKPRNTLYLDGYFQSEKYFHEIREALLNEFTFPSLDPGNAGTRERILNFQDPVAVHVRRGDYLKAFNQNIHGSLTQSYYKNAAALIGENVEAPFYFIFSTDRDWCEENFKFLGDRYFIVSGNNSEDAWKDMYLMTQCKHHIIANSSFSWWGAWLSIHQKGIRTAPAEWYNSDVVTFDISDFIPPSWQIVDNV